MHPSPIAKILHAAAFAADRHRNQRRKDAEASPYVNHPLGLAEVLARVGGVTDADVLCAALLHDTLEDTETRRDELVAAFGEAVAGMVEEVTDDKSLPKDERKRLQVEHAAHLSAGARLVKLADKISNVGDVQRTPPADWSDARRQAYIDWASSVVRALGPVHPELEALFWRTADRTSAHGGSARSTQR